MALGRFISVWWPPGPLLSVMAGRIAASASLAVGFLLLCDAVGQMILRWIASARPRGAVRLAAAFLGYGIVSLGVLGLAAAGLWFAPVLAGGLGLVLLVSSRCLSGTIRAWGQATRGAWRDLALAGRTVAVLLLGWSLILLAPPEIHIDSLEYHLAYPQQALIAHSLIGHGYMNWTNPLAADLPNVFALLVGLDPAAKMLHPLFALLGALVLLRALGVRPWSAKGLAATWLALMLPRGAAAFFTAKSDAIVCGTVLVALAMARPGRRSRRFPVHEVAFAGAAVGLVASMKIVVAPVAAVALALALWHLPSGRRWVGVRLLLPWALVPFLPWALKSWLFTGDPVYPVGVSRWPGLSGDGAADRMTGQALALFSDPARRLFASPWEALRLAAVNALPAFAILPVLWRSRAAGVRDVLAAAAIAAAIQTAGLRFGLDIVERFAGPAFVAGNLAACAVVLTGSGRAWRVSRAALVVLVLVAHVRATALSLGGAAPAVAALLAGRTAPEAFRTEALGSYGRILPEVRQVTRDSGPHGRVLEAGDTVSWGVPVRVLGEGLGPRLPWVAARESNTEQRMSIRYRQAGVRWVLHNAWKAGWARLHEQPYAWDARMLRLYEAWVRRHLRLRAFSGREDPIWGSHWLFEVSRAPASAPVPRALFLPGAEDAFGRTTRAALGGDVNGAVSGFRSLRRLLPGVVALDAVLGHLLTRAGRYREAYPLVRASVDAGVVYEMNLFDWAITAGHLGRRGEAVEALRRAGETCPGWPDFLIEARWESGVAR